MGTGEHYLVDLIVAYPFALLLQALCKTSLPMTSARRLRPMLTSLITILAWFGLLAWAPRFFWISPVISWVVAIATVGGSIALQRWMNMEDGEVVPPVKSNAVAQ